MLEQQKDSELRLTPDRLGASLPARDCADAHIEKLRQVVDRPAFMYAAALSLTG